MDEKREVSNYKTPLGDTRHRELKDVVVVVVVEAVVVVVDEEPWE